MVKKLSSLIILTALLLVGCTIKYEDDENIKKSDQIPDSKMTNFHLVKVKDNKIQNEVFAEKAEIFENQDLTVLYNIEFREYNKDGTELVTQGNIGRVEYKNDSKDANLTEGITFYSQKEDMEITGENLYWKDQTKELESDIDSLIKVNKGDGSLIEGYGFTASIIDSTFSFKRGITGYTP